MASDGRSRWIYWLYFTVWFVFASARPLKKLQAYLKSFGFLLADDDGWCTGAEPGDQSARAGGVGKREKKGGKTRSMANTTAM
jgi:hypothetical protein